MKRALAALGVVIVLAVAVYWFFLRDGTTVEEAPVRPPRAVARIGEGSKAVAVSQAGKVMPPGKLPAEPELPLLPLKAPPKGGRVKGPVLKEVEVLAAAPAALRPYLAGTSYDGKEGGGGGRDHGRDQIGLRRRLAGEAQVGSGGRRSLPTRPSPPSIMSTCRRLRDRPTKAKAMNSRPLRDS